MKDYILYSLPLDFAAGSSESAIDHINNFKVRVRHIDSNTFKILSVLDNKSGCTFCTPETQLELHQFAHLRRYYYQMKWNAVKPKFRNCLLISIK